jgi:prevent-host-death family protein
MEVNIHQAKTHLSELLRRVVGGDEITICRAGVPVARLIAAKPQAKPRPLGMYRGQFTVPEDFDAPLPDELLAQFYGGEVPKPIKRAGKKRGRRGAA